MWEKVVGNILFSASAFFLASGDSGGDYFKAIQPVFKNPGKYGPWILPTRGKAWPKPKVEKEIFGRFSILEPERFEFLVSRNTFCHLHRSTICKIYSEPSVIILIDRRFITHGMYGTLLRVF